MGLIQRNLHDHVVVAGFGLFRALLAAMGNFDEIPMHIRASRTTGAEPRDVLQAFMHVAIYAGVPKANHAIKLAKQVWSELDKGEDA